jgi:hypothetical protein
LCERDARSGAPQREDFAMNEIAQERRRLSAAWLNILAAGVITAGSVAPLSILVGTAWSEATGRLLLLCLVCLLIGVGLHLAARLLLRHSSCTPDPAEHS